jgi:hypothetical protein
MSNERTSNKAPVPASERKFLGGRTRVTMTALVLAGTTFSAAIATAGTEVTVESVDVYVNGPLSNRVANGTGFLNTMLTGGFFTRSPAVYTNSSVYDTDFMDPDVTGNYRFSDTSNFDRPGTAISFFSGHGVCNSGQADQPCTSNSQCTRPPTNLRGGGATCVFVASQTTGYCHYQAPRYLGTNSPSNFQSSADSYVIYNNFTDNNNVWYPRGYTPVAWGESPTAGNWRSAGTNGGTNMVVLDVSCGAYVGSLLADLGPENAGAHMIATVMPTAGDTSDTPNRGRTFANGMVVNRNSSVANSWVDLVSTMSATDGQGCGIPGGGGGRGINGCGGYAVVAVGATSGEAVDHINESWADIQNDAKDTKGIAWWISRTKFNYDAVRNPPLH